MKPTAQNIITGEKINMELLLNAATKPELFSTGEKLFWNDPHISTKMLEAHLDPEWEAASRKRDTIDKTVDWLVEYLKLGKGSKILDIGCGPGLYCSRFHNYGVNVTGMDYSRNSINYAVNCAAENRQDIRYVYQDYLTMDYDEEYDAIFLIYCDFGALTNADRDVLLKKIRRALKPDGVFVFDVFTVKINTPVTTNWSVCESGFWRPGAHLVLDQVYHYEEENVYLNQHLVIDGNGEVAVYKIWDHYYSVETITQVMETQGFRVGTIWSDLTGKPNDESSITLGVIVEKADMD